MTAHYHQAFVRRSDPYELPITRNLYSVGLIFVIVFAALWVPGESPPQLLAAIYHVFADFTVLWICLVIALWHIVTANDRELKVTEVAFGSMFATAAALSGGLWPWLLLCGMVWLFRRGVDNPVSRQALFLVFALGIHEAFVNLSGAVFGDALLGIDAWIAAFLTGWFIPGVVAAGTMLQATDGHALLLVWGCSSLSYVGDMMLLCWALAMLIAGDAGVRRDLWIWLLLVALITIALNTARLGLMAMEPHMYQYLHHGDGAIVFRVANLLSVVGITWLQADHAIVRKHSAV